MHSFLKILIYLISFRSFFFFFCFFLCLEIPKHDVVKTNKQKTHELNRVSF